MSSSEELSTEVRATLSVAENRAASAWEALATAPDGVSLSTDDLADGSAAHKLVEAVHGLSAGLPDATRS